MSTGWQRQYAAVVRDANRLFPEERWQLRERQKHATQPLSRRFYCPNTYQHPATGEERVCGYWPAEHVWWNNDEPYCDCCRTPLEMHPGLNPKELKRERRMQMKERGA